MGNSDEGNVPTNQKSQPESSGPPLPRIFCVLQEARAPISGTGPDISLPSFRPSSRTCFGTSMLFDWQVPLRRRSYWSPPVLVAGACSCPALDTGSEGRPLTAAHTLPSVSLARLLFPHCRLFSLYLSHSLLGFTSSFGIHSSFRHPTHMKSLRGPHSYPSSAWSQLCALEHNV